jgi:hypothetical protein
MNLWPSFPSDLEALDALESNIFEALFATAQLLPACVLRLIVGRVSGPAEAGHYNCNDRVFGPAEAGHYNCNDRGVRL